MYSDISISIAMQRIDGSEYDRSRGLLCTFYPLFIWQAKELFDLTYYYCSFCAHILSLLSLLRQVQQQGTLGSYFYSLASVASLIGFIPTTNYYMFLYRSFNKLFFT
ncbi:hypothetical protein SETIT_6G022700v2 [Setaria italica]|uniref:Uncharacterized protein n=1 Tax=Setaria italica TaxID=4555 RepID=A0A368RH68_SETIT|nr:hypothetical protein SETIT_6G022700v2 [Setaria italica]